jgi:hypothetical protein
VGKFSVFALGSQSLVCILYDGNLKVIFLNEAKRNSRGRTGPADPKCLNHSLHNAAGVQALGAG